MSQIDNLGKKPGRHREKIAVPLENADTELPLERRSYDDGLSEPEMALFLKERSDNVSKVVDRANLSPREREFFDLTFEEGLTQEEIARKLNVSPGWTSTLKFGVVRKIKKELRRK